MPVVPPEPRHTVEETSEGLRFYIPSPKRWYLVLFLGLWLFLWIGIGSQFVLGVFLRTSAENDWFRVLWSLGWFLSIGYVILVLS